MRQLVIVFTFQSLVRFQWPLFSTKMSVSFLAISTDPFTVHHLPTDGLVEKKVLFVDLADPRKRTREDIRRCLDTLKRLQRHVNVVLSVNYSEAKQCLEVRVVSPHRFHHRDARAHAHTHTNTHTHTHTHTHIHKHANTQTHTQKMSTTINIIIWVLQTLKVKHHLISCQLSPCKYLGH